MRKTVLVLWLVVLVGAVCAWAKPQPEPSEIIMEIDRDAGEVAKMAAGLNQWTSFPRKRKESAGKI